jgi:hypothetical protein
MVSGSQTTRGNIGTILRNVPNQESEENGIIGEILETVGVFESIHIRIVVWDVQKLSHRLRGEHDVLAINVTEKRILTVFEIVGEVCEEHLHHHWIIIQFRCCGPRSTPTSVGGLFDLKTL